MLQVSHLYYWGMLTSLVSVSFSFGTGCEGRSRSETVPRGLKAGIDEMHFDLRVSKTNVAVGDTFQVRIVPRNAYEGGVSMVSFSCRKLGDGIDSSGKLLLEMDSAHHGLEHDYFDGLDTRQSSHPASLSSPDFPAAHTFDCVGNNTGLFMIQAKLFVWNSGSTQTIVESQAICVLVGKSTPP